MKAICFVGSCDEEASQVVGTEDPETGTWEARGYCPEHAARVWARLGRGGSL